MPIHSSDRSQLPSKSGSGNGQQRREPSRSPSLTTYGSATNRAIARAATPSNSIRASSWTRTPLPTRDPKPSTEQVLNGRPLIDYWNYNSLTARAYQLIEEYDSGAEIPAYELATGPSDYLEGTFTAEYATSAGYSSLTITVEDRAGKQILSYIGASVAGTRVLTVDLPGMPRYKYHRQYGKVVVHIKAPEGYTTFRATKKADGSLKTEGTVKEYFV